MWLPRRAAGRTYPLAPFAPPVKHGADVRVSLQHRPYFLAGELHAERQPWVHTSATENPTSVRFTLQTATCLAKHKVLSKICSRAMHHV